MNRSRSNLKNGVFGSPLLNGMRSIPPDIKAADDSAAFEDSLNSYVRGVRDGRIFFFASVVQVRGRKALLKPSEAGFLFPLPLHVLDGICL